MSEATVETRDVSVQTDGDVGEQLRVLLQIIEHRVGEGVAIGAQKLGLPGRFVSRRDQAGDAPLHAEVPRLVRA